MAVRSGRRAGRPTMVLHYLDQRVVPGDGVPGGLVAGDEGARSTDGPRAGFVVGKSVGNSVCRHRVTRQLRHLVRAELHRLPDGADLVVRARPEAATAGSAALGRDLRAGLDRVLGRSAATARPSSSRSSAPRADQP